LPQLPGRILDPSAGHTRESYGNFDVPKERRF
jgi:hypothetical protein